MILTPAVVGMLASRPAWVHLALLAFWLVGYFAFFATGLWLKSGRRPRYRRPVVVYVAVSAALGVLTLAMDPGLLRWAPLFVPPAAVGLVASANRTERSLVSGLATTVGSSMMVLVAYDAGGGTDWPTAWLLTAVLAAYFAGTVLYVKTNIRKRGSRGYYLLSIAVHGLATAVLVPVSVPMAVVFAALTVRAAVVPRLSVTVKQLGLGEVVSTVAVALTALASLA